jgi:hypothetical protein
MVIETVDKVRKAETIQGDKDLKNEFKASLW